MRVTLVATPNWIRFAIASWLSNTNYDHILYSFLINSNTMFPKVCVASKDYKSFMSINTTNYKSNQIRSGNWCHCHLQHDQPSMNYHLLNLNVMSHAIKLLELPCFSVDSLYTQLPIVVWPDA